MGKIQRKVQFREAEMFASPVKMKFLKKQIRMEVLLRLTYYILLCPHSLCTIITILLTLWNSEQKNGLLIKLFCFASDFDKFHKVSSKSDKKQKSFINSPFFCTEFQSVVSRIVKIVHSAHCNAIPFTSLISSSCDMIFSAPIIVV